MPKYIAVDFYDEPDSDIICCSDSLEECQEKVFDWIEENNGNCRTKIFEEVDDTLYTSNDVTRAINECIKILHKDTYGEQSNYSNGWEEALKALKEELQKASKWQRCRMEGEEKCPKST